jgi:hypothetical protein
MPFLPVVCTCATEGRGQSCICFRRPIKLLKSCHNQNWLCGAHQQAETCSAKATFESPVAQRADQPLHLTVYKHKFKKYTGNSHFRLKDERECKVIPRSVDWLNSGNQDRGRPLANTDLLHRPLDSRGQVATTCRCFLPSHLDQTKTSSSPSSKEKVEGCGALIQRRPDEPPASGVANKISEGS